MLETNLPKDLKGSTVDILEQNEDMIEDIEYNKEINVGSLKANEYKIITYFTTIQKLEQNNDQIAFSVNVKQNEDVYKSNVYYDKLNNVDVNISMTSPTAGQLVEEGDILQYNIVVKNNSNSGIYNLTILDSIPEILKVTKITINGKDLKDIFIKDSDESDTSEYSNEYTNDVEVTLFLDANSTSTIIIETIVRNTDTIFSDQTITNTSTAEFWKNTLSTSSAVTHIIKATGENNPSTPNDPDTPDTPGSPSTPDTPGSSGSPNTPGSSGNSNGNENNDIENNNIATGNKTISGTAWFDENKNGQRDSGEDLLNNIKVRLLNVETNTLVTNSDGNLLEALTDENGVYTLNKIGNGKYIVLFGYDNSQYGLTKYKAKGIPETQNSDATLNELSIENQKHKLASTDIIEINNNDISNIDIGLIKLEIFDLKLNKYVDRILVQNAKGITIKEYGNSQLAKLEIEGKYLNGSTVIIEYKIDVTNNGELAGYTKKIADYIPSDLKFNSELNKDWYEVDNVLYTDILANDEIKPGETKTISLTLTKAMTENNTGSIANIAEIAEDYNELGIKDTNSTPGNRTNTENDYSMAETLITVKTGAVMYIGLIIVAIAMLGATTIILIIKNKNNQQKF